MTPLVLIGGGGHCKSVIDVIESSGIFFIHGILDPNIKERTLLGYPVIGSDEDIPHLVAAGFSFHITVGHIKSNHVRKQLFQKVKEQGGELPVIISGAAIVSRHCRIEEGTIIMHHVVINAGSEIGRNCIINTSCIIEHDARVSDHCHISTGAVINGGVIIEQDSFIGSNSTIIQEINVGSSGIVGAGTVVLKDIPGDSTIVGNPGRIRQTDENFIKTEATNK